MVDNHAVVSSDCAVDLFKLKPLKHQRTMAQRSGEIRDLDGTAKGLIAIGSDESDIHLVDIFNLNFSQVISGHKVFQTNKECGKRGFV